MPDILDRAWAVQAMFAEAEKFMATATLHDPRAGHYSCVSNLTGSMSDPLRVRPTFVSKTTATSEMAREPDNHQQHSDPDTIAELVSRMIESRSRRWDFQSRRIRPMRRDWWEYAMSAYPQIEHVPEISPAWGDLLIATTKWISEDDKLWNWTDVSEKLGRIRLSARGLGSDLAFEIVSAAEHLSTFVCFVCGGPGQARHDHTTLCNKHFLDRSWRTTGHE